MKRFSSSSIFLILSAFLLLQWGCGTKPQPEGPGAPTTHSPQGSTSSCDTTLRPCANGAPCVNGVCQPTPPPPPPLASCRTSKDCSDGACRGGSCVTDVSCSSTSECKLMEVCDSTSGKCRRGDSCSATVRCPASDQTCYDERCSPLTRKCVSHDDCENDEVCDANECRKGTRCGNTSDCQRGKEICEQTICTRFEDIDRCAPGHSNSLQCKPEVEKCEANRCVPSCAPSELCGSVCCASTEVCISDTCVKDPCSGDTSRQACGTGTAPICCAANEACINNSCIPFSAPCDNVDAFCPIIEYCDLSPAVGGHCVNYEANAANLCLYPDSQGKFEGKRIFSWAGLTGQPGSNLAYNQVMTIPLVGDVTGPGGVKDKIPDLVINTYENYNWPEANIPGILRVMSAKVPDAERPTENIEYYWDSQSIRENAQGRGLVGSALDDYENFWTFGLTTAALGDVNRDHGKIYVVVEERIPPATPADSETFRLRAVDAADGKTLWKSPVGVAHNSDRTNAIALADLDHDNAVEVIFNRWVLDGADGHILCELKDSQSNKIYSATPFAANLDETGNMEIVLGFQTFSYVRDPVTNIATCTPRPSDPSQVPPTYISYPADDKAYFSAVADILPANQGPEIIGIHTNALVVADQNGKELWRKALPNNDLGGPPTVADFDGDGTLEVAVSSHRFYVLAKPTLPATEKFVWTMPVQEGSSGITGSSVFDFDGDGKAEVVYADEVNLHIYDGSPDTTDPDHPKAKERMTIENRSATVIEYPLVVDSNADGHADIVVVANLGHVAPGGRGVSIFTEKNNKWVPTRSVWNQHTYHYTNVNDDLTIPVDEAPHWKSAWSNNFRQNVQQGNSRFAPDLTVKLQDLRKGLCSATDDIRTIQYAIVNNGAREVPANSTVSTVSVALSDVTPKTFTKIHSEPNITSIPPGGSVNIIYDWSLPSTYRGRNLDILVEVNKDASVLECDMGNNSVQVTDLVPPSAPNLTLQGLTPLAVCDYMSGEVTIHFEMINRGSVEVPVGDAVAQILLGTEGNLKAIKSVKNSKKLGPNEAEAFSFTMKIDDPKYNGKQFIIKVVADPNDTVKECAEDDNVLEVPKDFQCYKVNLG